jgi:hypothetical protein
VLRVHWAGLDQKIAMRSIERLGRIVAKLKK